MSDPLSGPSVSRAVRFATTGGGGGGGSTPPDIFPTAYGTEDAFVYALQVNGVTVDTVAVNANQIGQGYSFTVRRTSSVTLNAGDVIRVVCTSQPEEIWNGCNWAGAGTSLNYLRIRVRGGGVLGPSSGGYFLPGGGVGGVT